MTILITAEKALSLLQNAVAAKGADYVYPRSADSITKICVYTRGGEPSCGVGYALHEAGVSIEGLEALDNADTEMWQTTAIGEENVQYVLRNELDVLITDEAVSVFSAFQSAQDSGEEWGVALKYASREASLVSA